MKPRIPLQALAALALVAGATPAFPVEEAPPTTVDNVHDVTTLDEVVVSGRLGSLAALRQAIVEAEDRFYARFNEVNEHDDFDVQCRTLAPTGTRIPERVCAPVIMDEVTRQAALGLFSITNGNARIDSTAEIRRRLAPEVRRQTLAALEKDAELRLALLQHAKLLEIYSEVHERKFADRRIVLE